ncbi:HigA family addiction module antitoxin [Youhaiella tibetensis]|nr:HigA family addiction module antitoxin [Youhaiella tibetensis]
MTSTWKTIIEANMEEMGMMPPHPGDFLKTEIVEAYGLTVTDAANILGVTRPALSALLNQRSSLSPEMALRFEKAFGIGMETMLRMQTGWDIAQQRKREAEIHVVRYQPAAA